MILISSYFLTFWLHFRLSLTEDKNLHDVISEGGLFFENLICIVILNNFIQSIISPQEKCHLATKLTVSKQSNFAARN